MQARTHLVGKAHVANPILVLRINVASDVVGGNRRTRLDVLEQNTATNKQAVRQPNVPIEIVRDDSLR